MNAERPPGNDPIAPLRVFVQMMTRLVGEFEPSASRPGAADLESSLLDAASEALGLLLKDDRWLPDEFAQAPAGVYRQYLLHCDPFERFSVVSFAWGPGARTPIHNHTVWGLVGALRGAERCDEYAVAEDGGIDARGCHHLMLPGMIDRVSPTIGDWHQVSNADPAGTSVSIHVYGANIGSVRRQRLVDGRKDLHEFISGYSGVCVPDIRSCLGN
jgi:predicted metal-dependent enzyme (double-stranded beta helix superfamily)